ncbi:alpha-2-macroglobulin family protein [Tenacibaculum piscium]|uniref:alpha-2-macroglobulin family protein n=1 Tax=Tenacibaculum piscium TaxID=1458515 RepID=UPI001F303120|nr:MG2 domain-containing protein [Tenacibaculum piscium]
MLNLIKILTITLLLFGVNGCKKSTNSQNQDENQQHVNYQKYDEYLASFPQKIVPAVTDFEFILKKTPKITTIDPSETSIFSIHPKVKGNVFLDENTLKFVPSEKLKSNTEYKITLHLSKLYDKIPADLQNFTTTVKTNELLFNITFSSPVVVTQNTYEVEGMVTLSDVIASENLSKLLKATYNKQNILINFDTSQEFVSKASFKIKNLKRADDDKNLLVSWEGDAINSRSKGQREITITGKKNFKVLNVEIVDADKQHIVVSFSDPIKKSQDLKGLIQFKNTQKRQFTYQILNNTITIYPKSTFKSKVTIEVFKGIKNTAGFGLKETYQTMLHFEELKPTVSFIKSGTIIPASKNLKINFKAVNLKAVDVLIYKIYKNNVLQFLQNNNLDTQHNLQYVGRPEAKYTVNLTNQGVDLTKENAFAVDLSEILSVENGAMYRVEFSFIQEYSNYTCQENSQENLEENKLNTTIIYGKKEIATKQYDTDTYYGNYDYRNYRWSDRENPCTNSYYYNKNISLNILATNLGAIAKKGNNQTTFIAVTDLVTTKPVADATVTLYNLQQQSIVSAKTNTDGIVNFDTPQNTFFAVISKDESTTYVKLNDGNALSMSKFDVSGTKLQEGITGYIYGERGVWRPGDNLFLTFVLNDKANPIPEKHPIKFELINPQGKIIERKIVFKNNSNVYNYAPKTNPEAITGNWNVKISVGGAVFNKTLKIETIKPNRLKINLKTTNNLNNPSDFIKSNENIQGDVAVKWLHGAIARNLKLDINGKFTQLKTEFSKFKNYHFDDLTRRFRTEEFKVIKGTLNNDGEINFSVKPSLKNKAPGMLKASFITKVYENGGDFSTDVFSKKISPYKSYAGILNAEEEGSKNYLFTDKKYTFNIASVNENSEGIINDLEVKVYKLSWRWWWSTSDNGLSNYDGTRYHEPYKTVHVKTNANGKGTFDLKVSENDWGRYLIKVTDKKSKHVTSNIAYFDWPSWYGNKKNQDKTNATMLVFTTDKEAYQVGEIANVKFPSSEGGRALITIENGTQVLDHFWVETSEKQTEFNFPVLENYTPNVFVNISLLQKHSQTVNDLPIRMYGVIPMLVYNPETKLSPEIKLPNELRPEETATLNIKEKNGKPMTYTIALVDEGLLDLTRFKTPNPWNTFYARQSLGVKTWDIFDEVIGAYGGKVNQILSIGGDEAEAGSKNKKANRFKPMVTYLGPFKLEKGKNKTHQIKIPKYVGAVRAMVVATDAQNNAYGSAEKTAFVRKPVMILASLPRKITPQETVTLPVNVFAMLPSVKNVKVTVEPNESFTILGSKTQSVSFEQPDEKMVYFTLKVNDFKGIGKVKIKAVSGREKASYEVEIDVLNPNPVTTEVKDLILKSNEKSQLSFTTFGSLGTNTASVELSTLPPMNFTKRMEYLIQYPHGCVEQTTSSAFPQLYLAEIFELSEEKQQDIERNIKATIQRLSDFQVANGGLSYWQGNSNADNWGTSYAGHFMIEASKKGYALPIGFRSKWVNYQKQQARNWRNNSRYQNNSLAQAYRLYTLSLANSADMASMNRLRETNGISNQAKIRLASAYALIGKKSIANQILNEALNQALNQETNNSNKNKYTNYGSETRNKAMELETYILLNHQTKAIKIAKEIADKLSSQHWMSTQTTAYSLLAMSKYALQNGENTGIKASYIFNQNNKSRNINTSKALFIEDLKNVLEQNKTENKLENKLEISNKSNGVLYVRVFNKGILPVGEEKVFQHNLQTTITYQTKDGVQIMPDIVSQGTNFIAEVTVKNTTNTSLENVALTQYIPSGWEIINTRFTDFGNNTTSSKVDFIDIRDASIHTYFSLNGYQTKTFKILLNASYLGTYYLPGVQVQAMYDNDYIARTKGEWINVIK